MAHTTEQDRLATILDYPPRLRRHEPPEISPGDDSNVIPFRRPGASLSHNDYTPPADMRRLCRRGLRDQMAAISFTLTFDNFFSLKEHGQQPLPIQASLQRQMKIIEDYADRRGFQAPVDTPPQPQPEATIIALPLSTASAGADYPELATYSDLDEERWKRRND